MLMKTGILYFTTCFHGFAILRHVDPFVRMLHIFPAPFYYRFWLSTNTDIDPDFDILVPYNVPSDSPSLLPQTAPGSLNLAGSGSGSGLRFPNPLDLRFLLCYPL